MKTATQSNSISANQHISTVKTGNSEEFCQSTSGKPDLEQVLILAHKPDILRNTVQSTLWYNNLKTNFGILSHVNYKTFVLTQILGCCGASAKAWL